MTAAPDRNDKARTPLLAPWRILRAHYRLAICGAVGFCVGLLLPPTVSGGHPPFDWAPIELTAVTRGLIGWNVATLLYLYAAARMILRSTHESIRRRALLSDEGRGAVLVLTATATFVAIGAIVAELGQSKSMFVDEKGPHIFLAVVTVFSSWAFMHLIFAFHYAHEFYVEFARAEGVATVGRGGLHFPNTPTPQYIDFLYFSFVIGVACQTADVEICSRMMRGVALAHAVAAFFFNTTILALMVNISSQFV